MAVQDDLVLGRSPSAAPGRRTPSSHPPQLAVRDAGGGSDRARSGVGAALRAQAHATAATEGYAAVELPIIDTNERAAALPRTRVGRVPDKDWTPVPHVLLLVSRHSVCPSAAQPRCGRTRWSRRSDSGGWRRRGR